MFQQPQEKFAAAQSFPCDADGVIRCSVTETVTAERSLEDLRIIAKYIGLVAERNRRYYMTWQEKLPSAAYEVVRRIRPFPFLPYGDIYGITRMQLIVQQSNNRIVVRYPKRPDDPNISELSEDDYVTYDTDLARFIKTIEKETAKLKKYEKRE